MVIESGTSVKDSYVNSTESSREDSEDELAELAGAHHPYIFFEPEDTPSDYSESFRRK